MKSDAKHMSTISARFNKITSVSNFSDNCKGYMSKPNKNGVK